MAIFNPPPELDLNYYRNVYPELNGFRDDILKEHYRRYAVEQGRTTCPYDRSETLKVLLQNTIDSGKFSALEISPWDNPLVRGENVKYFGTEDSEALRKSAVKANRYFNQVPEKIHFVSPTADLGIVNETFDIVVSSHVIEHTPDLISHLRAVSKILNKGGVYVLVIPDKRYCFDHYNSESTIMEVIDAFINERKNPRLADFVYEYTHNYALLHWLGEHGKNQQEMTLEKLTQKIQNYSAALAKGEYINAHNWRFTPDSFGYIIDMLNKLNIIDLKKFRLCHTIWGRFEFVAMLEK